jgi:hypothetical protein
MPAQIDPERQKGQLGNIVRFDGAKHGIGQTRGNNYERQAVD